MLISFLSILFFFTIFYLIDWYNIYDNSELWKNTWSISYIHTLDNAIYLNITLIWLCLYFIQ